MAQVGEREREIGGEERGGRRESERMRNVEDSFEY
jgi:hypothetical protein